MIRMPKALAHSQTIQSELFINNNSTNNHSLSSHARAARGSECLTDLAVVLTRAYRSTNSRQQRRKTAMLASRSANPNGNSGGDEGLSSITSWKSSEIIVSRTSRI